MEQIPNAVETQQAARHLDAALLQRLEVRRFREKTAKKPRGKKVSTGQSYTLLEEDEDKEDEGEEDEGEEDEGEEDEGEEDEGEKDEGEEDEGEKDEGEEDKGEEDEELSDETENEEEVDAILCGGGDAGSAELPDLHGSPDVGSNVVAIYEKQRFLAEVAKDRSNVKKGYMHLAYMVIKGKNSFSQPCKPDLHITLEEDIIRKDVLPEPVYSCGCLGLTKKDFDKVLSLMVVFFIYSNAYYQY